MSSAQAGRRDDGYSLGDRQPRRNLSSRGWKEPILDSISYICLYSCADQAIDDDWAVANAVAAGKTRGLCAVVALFQADDEADDVLVQGSAGRGFGACGG